jgi:hypothetical protein
LHYQERNTRTPLPTFAIVPRRRSDWLGLAAVLATAATALRAISCDTAQGGSDFYDGPSTSKKDNTRFSNSAAVP